MSIKIKYFIIFILAGAAMLSCGNKTEGNKQENTPENQTIITNEQFNENGMELGKPKVETFADEVTCNGYITSPVNGSAKVTTLIPGQIAAIYTRSGKYVSKGDIICTIKSTDFINIQKNYADAAARFAKIKADYERVKALRQDNIGAEKDYITAQSDYNVASASLNAMEATLKAVGLNPSEIKSGKIYGEYEVKAPISGFITDVMAVLGEYADVSTVIAGIVNTKQVELTLSVFEKDVHKLKAGQTVKFQIAEDKEYLPAKLTTIGKSVNPESKAIDCIADIDPSVNVPLVNEGYVKANIITDTTNLTALPNTAVVKSEGSLFIYILKEKKSDHYIFEKKLVHVIKSNDNFSAVQETLPDKEIIIKGGSTL